MAATDDLLKDISSKLDKMNKLLAVGLIKNLESEQEKIELLDSIGFSSSEIARVMNKSIQNVCVQLNQIAKKKEKVEKKPHTPKSGGEEVVQSKPEEAKKT